MKVFQQIISLCLALALLCSLLLVMAIDTNALEITETVAAETIPEENTSPEIIAVEETVVTTLPAETLISETPPDETIFFEGITENGEVFAAEEDVPVTSGTCGENLTWVFDEEAGTLTISGTGAMASYSREGSPWYPYWEKIGTLIVEEGVTSIGSYAFADCQRIMSATIPQSIISIEKGAFLYCVNLSDVYITNLTAWCNIANADSSPGSNLYVNGILKAEIDIPKDATKISSYSFHNKNGITKVTIPIPNIAMNLSR